MSGGGGNGIGSFEHLKEPNGAEGYGQQPSEEAAFQAAIKHLEEKWERERQARKS